MKKNILFLGTLLIGEIATAASSGHGENTIPLTEIGWQAANVSLLALAMFFFLRNSVKETFAKRKSDFIDQAEKTKHALKLAENELKDTKTKLADLENGESKAIENAKHEANLIKANLIKEAEAQAAKIKADAELTIKNEIMKAKAEINAIVLNEAVILAKSKITSQAPQNLQAIETRFLAQVENSKHAKAVQ